MTGNVNGVLQYGNVIRSGKTRDTSFTISGLTGNKHYGIFISYSCGQKLTVYQFHHLCSKGQNASNPDEQIGLLAQEIQKVYLNW